VTQFRKEGKIAAGGAANIFDGILDEQLQKKFGFQEIVIKEFVDAPHLTEDDQQINFQQEISIMRLLTNDENLSVNNYTQSNPQTNIAKLIGYTGL